MSARLVGTLRETKDSLKGLPNQNVEYVTQFFMAFVYKFTNLIKKV